MKKLITQAELARRCGISTPAISKAIKAGHVALNINRKVDMRNPKNEAYVIEKKEKFKNKRIKEEIAKAEEVTAKAESKIAELKGKVEPGPPPPSDGHAGYAPGMAPTSSKLDAEIAKIQASTTKMHIAVAKEMDILILKSMVDQLYGKQYRIISNLILPQGKRLAAIVCGVCGISDTDIELQVEKEINNENSVVLREFKRLMAEQVTNQMEEDE